MDATKLDNLRRLAAIGGRRERAWALLNGVPIHSSINGQLLREYPNGKKVVVENYLNGPEREVPYHPSNEEG